MCSRVVLVTWKHRFFFYQEFFSQKYEDFFFHEKVSGIQLSGIFLFGIVSGINL